VSDSSPRKTFLSISAHIGDGELTAGPLLAQMALDGHRVEILDLTPGERGHPRLTPEEYKVQKMHEAQFFADAIGAGFRVFDDLTDGFLGTGDDVCLRVADVIRELRPDVVVAHWNNSIHSDHVNASAVAERGRFLAGLPLERPNGCTPWGVGTFLYAENWEDAEGFAPNLYVPISEEAFERWHRGICEHAFARGETYGFRYIDYYTALMTVRGALAGGKGFPRAVALATPSGGNEVVTAF